MINYDYLEFYKTVISAKKNNKPAVFKNFLDDKYIPEWNDILKSIYVECQNAPSEELRNIIEQNENESLVGNVIIGKNLFLCIAQENSERNQNYFPHIFNMIDEIRQKTELNISLIGPKISVGPAQNLSHTDNWDAFSLQCEGSTKWILSDSSYINTPKESINYVEEFIMNRGDLVFFPQKMWHQINTEAPRANLQFNTIIN